MYWHGVGMLLWTRDEHDKGMVLLVKRSINPGKGKWSVSGWGWDLGKDSFDD